MRFKVETRDDKEKRLREWHNWFAWRPVRINREIVWLETIQRSGLLRDRPYEKSYWKWFYRNKNDE